MVDQDDISSISVASNEITISIVPPTGEDAKALELIEQGLAQQLQERSPQIVDDGDQSFVEQAIFEKILKETRSARFHASALARLLRFRAIAEAEGASHYLNGLARCRLLRVRFESESGLDRQTGDFQWQSDAGRAEVLRMARSLLWDFPDTYIGDEASQILKLQRRATAK